MASPNQSRPKQSLFEFKTVIVITVLDESTHESILIREFAGGEKRKLAKIDPIPG